MQRVQVVCRLMLAVAAAAAVLGRGPAHATTFVMMSDAALVRSAAVIVLGVVDGISTGSDPTELSTAVRIAVEQQLKGPPQETVTLVVPGGAAGGVRRVVYGTPQFYLGERVLVFLRRRPDGQLTPVGLAMGKYSVVSTAAGVLAHRQLGGPQSTVLAYDRQRGRLQAAAATDERALGDFLARLRRLVAAAPAPPTPAAKAVSASRFDAAFTFLGQPPARWIEPDLDEPVGYQVIPSGDAALGLPASMAALTAAMAAWSNAGSSLRLINAGPGTPAPFTQCDGKSTVQFNDPFGEIGPPVNCGGVLAIGGFCTSAATTSTVNGVTFLRITEGDVTVNAGFGGCSYWTETNLAEVLTHELGHTIGLGHSSENPNEPNPVLRNATMFYMAHFDGRGASIEADDIAGVQALYPPPPSPSPTPAPAPMPVRLRDFTLDGSRGALVVSALVDLPAGTSFLPGRDALAIRLSDNLGVLYEGTMGARALRRSRINPLRYAGGIASPMGGGVVTFTVLGDNSGSLTLRITGADLSRATGEQTVLSLCLGAQTFAGPVALKPGAGGAWVLSAP